MFPILPIALFGMLCIICMPFPKFRTGYKMAYLVFVLAGVTAIIYYITKHP